MNFEFTNKAIKNRPIADSDMPLLYEIYASTRTAEIQSIGDAWTQAQKDGFLWQQFNAQHSHYQKHYKETNFWLLFIQNEAIGRLYIDFLGKEIVIVDITILPQFRNNGLGKLLLEDIIRYAKSVAKKVQIHVEKFNPALRLYERLNFKVVDASNDIYYMMEC